MVSEVMLESQLLRCFHGACTSHELIWGGGICFAPQRYKMNQRAAQVALSLIRDGRTQDMQEMTMKQAELEKVHVEIVKLLSEQRKLNAEAGKMTRETFWYPVAVATGLIGTVATITTVLIKLL